MKTDLEMTQEMNRAAEILKTYVQDIDFYGPGEGNDDALMHIGFNVNGFYFGASSYQCYTEQRSLLGVRKYPYEGWTLTIYDNEGDESNTGIEDVRGLDNLIMEAYIYGLRHCFEMHRRDDAMYDAYQESLQYTKKVTA